MAQIRDAMSTDFVWVQPHVTVHEAAKLMRDNNIGFMPIGENDRLIGILTDRDIMVRVVAAGLDAETETVRSVMTPRIYYCFENQNIAEVCDNMSFIKVRRLPVLNQDKRLVGIISMSDLAGAGGKAHVGESYRRIAEERQSQTQQEQNVAAVAAPRRRAASNAA